ncbi:IS200/IS605 family transposase [Lacipirellula parvula]|uniref:Transposase IS200-family protein n=1 Tax=Lacipirellula parvula TaxID=2650471 RepID=A0A5K7X6X8_9BACT|nr:IS200/IS605 family transposase [Lacipirellula parvula]BBO32484.1 transposase IS200-family protein [Lacipirellula parvula]
MLSTYSNLLYHIVFSTKDRERLITEGFKEELYRYMAGVTREEGGSLLEIGGIEDHVHLLAKFKPSITVSDMLRLIKTNSSKWLHEQKGHARFGWQEGYAAFSVSESQAIAVRRYIRNQAAHHRRQSFQDEFVSMLERHGVEYDPRFLWD